MNRLFATSLSFVLASSVVHLSAQYKQEEYQKYPVQKIFPKTKLDSAEAKAAIAVGETTIKGVAFTKPKTIYGYKAPLAERIYANHILIELFPMTPYYQEWYNLKKNEENLKKNKIVYMDRAAYKYRVTCETNSKGEFTFPKMKPGKYLIVGTLPWYNTKSYDQYTGSGYGNNGSVTDYYQRQYYSTTHSDFLMEVVEVPADKKEVKVKLN